MDINRHKQYRFSGWAPTLTLTPQASNLPPTVVHSGVILASGRVLLLGLHQLLSVLIVKARQPRRYTF